MLRCAVIDAGSNTVRAVVYQWEAGTLMRLYSKKESAGLLRFVENGLLTREGEERMRGVLERLSLSCRVLKCDRIYCFATAFLRDAKNGPQVLERIGEGLGLTVELLSGEEEARCDCLGLAWGMGGRLPAFGAGCDLGGGSLQLFTFRENCFQEAVSLPAGSLRMQQRYVSGVLPAYREVEAIYNAAARMLRDEPLAKVPQTETLWAMGGTARGAAKLHLAMLGRFPWGEKERLEETIHGYRLSLLSARNMLELLCDPAAEGSAILSKATPNRISTLLPGLTVLLAAADAVGAKELCISRFGVREGYLLSRLLGEPELQSVQRGAAE